MIRQLILSTFSLLLATSAFAQMPEAVQGTGKLGSQFSLEKLACADQFAGTITFGAFNGSSNDIDAATPIFLCLGDTYQINHNGDQDLTGDPQVTTPSGVTYGFYDGPPTVAGPNLTTILTDPNLILNGSAQTPIFISGTSGTSNGNLLLTNTGALQNDMSIGIGDGSPVQFWFAPITVDDFSDVAGTSGWEDDLITGEQGPCTNANINEAFSVVFLNELAASNQTIGTCAGSFTIEGGLPEFDGSNYDIESIALTTNPATMGAVAPGNYTHGDQVTFTVPQEGTYDITVRDDKNCPTVFQMTFVGPTDPLEIIASDETISAGSTVCVSFTANNFSQITSMQMTINYDETVLEILPLPVDAYTNFNLNVPGLNPASFNDNGAAVLLSWIDPATTGVTIPDGSVLFDICFNVIGTGNDVSPIEFDESVLINEIVGPCGELDFDPTAGSVTVTLEAFSIDLVGQDESCSGESDGQFTITVMGGTAPFDISWIGATTGANTGMPMIPNDGGSFTAMGLAPDDYTVTVVNNNGAMVTEMITVAGGFGFGVSPEYTSPTCFSDCDGSITAEIIINGVVIVPGPEYTFLWSGGGADGQTTQTVTGLCNANVSTSYAVAVTGPNMCMSSASETAFDTGPIDINPTITNSSCSSMLDGGIMLNITGGTTSPGNGYTIEWINGPTTVPNNTNNISTLLAGIYEILITDDNMCSATFFEEVETDKALSLDETIINIACNGDDNGSITAIATTSGGAPALPYNFSWNPPFLNAGAVNTASTTSVSDLAPGSYQLFLNDADGCATQEIYIIEEPMPLDITLVETTSETCATGMDGTATIAVEGGAYPYFYDWGVVGQTDSTATNLAADDYIVTVTDANMCSGTLAVTVNAPIPPIITTLADDILPCDNSQNGTLTVETMDGGSPITSIEWSTGDLDETTITGLLPGTYTVTVTAAGDGCMTVDTALVIAPEPLSASVSTTDTNCPGSGGGMVSLTVEGGDGNYTFAWDRDGVMLSDIGGSIGGGEIVAGNYNVTVSYGTACPTLELSATVNEPPHIEGDFSGIDGVSCYNLSGVPADGEATVTPYYANDIGNTQGQTWNITWQNLETPPTVFFQENGVLTSSANNLPQDEQFVIVSDGQCFDTLSVNIPAPAPLLATGSTVDVSCFGDVDGSVMVTGQGGTGDYMYNWSTGDVNVTSIDMLPPGAVTVVITDENNCNFTFAADVGEPEPFVAFTLLETQDSVSCFEGNDALISIGTNGGNPGILTYIWEDNIAASNQSTATDIGPGSWSVTVTDEKGCTDELTTLITQPDPITFEYSVDTIQCFGEDAEFRIDTVIGGTVDGYIEYTFSLDIIQPQLPVTTAFDLDAGDYVVSVFDNNDCEVSDTFSLTQPNPLTVDLPDVIEIELGDTMTQLLPIVLNDFPLDSILWTPIASGLSNDTILNPFVRNSVDDQSFKLRLVDIKGCMGMDEVRIKIDRNRNIYIPNVFSPNRDGYNDDFGVFGCLGVSRVVTAQVFDRWGELVADVKDQMPECQSVNGTVIWDGTFRGKPAPDGVYVYMIDIEFLDQKRLVYRGDVTVLK